MHLPWVIERSRYDLGRQRHLRKDIFSKERGLWLWFNRWHAKQTRERSTDGGNMLGHASLL